MKRISAVILLLVLFYCFGITDGKAESSSPLTILRVTPTGEDVPASQQIVLEFNRPVVPIGKMERTAEEIGIEISPPLKCQWRWLNTSSLSCNLNQEDTMASATKYIITVNPLITAEDGASLPKKTDFTFITQRPEISYVDFKTWLSPQAPLIRLTFKMPVSKSSVEQHIYFSTENSTNRVGSIVSPDDSYQNIPDYIFEPSQKKWIRIQQTPRKSDDQLTQLNGEEARRVWLIEPAAELPENSSVILKSEKGLTAAEGTETGIAEKDIVSFQTFPEFKFAGVSCRDNNSNDIMITPDETDINKKCNPMQPVFVAFTSPVLRSEVQNNIILSPDLAGGQKNYNPWGDENRDYSVLYEAFQKNKLYYTMLPVGLKAAQEYTLKFNITPENMTDQAKSLLGYALPENIEDEFGRKLVATAEMKFQTDHRNPNFVLAHHDAVLESQTDSEVPLYVNNLNSYGVSYRSITADEEKQSTYTKSVNKLQDIQYGVPLGVREILGGKTGAIYGTLTTNPVTPYKSEFDYRLFAQITPWQVHFKFGHFSSLAWVTDLSTGKPVHDATIKLYKGTYTGLSLPKEILAEAKTDENGIAVLPGSDKIDPKQILSRSWRDDEEHLFVYVEKNKETALLPLDGNYLLNLWQISDGNLWENTRNLNGHMKSWGMTAQGIYRAGDTMQYKIFLRGQNNITLTLPPKDAKYTLKITDPTGKPVQVIKDIKFSDFGAYSGEYTIPEKSAVGWYDFSLLTDFSDNTKPDPADNTNEEDLAANEDNLIYMLYPMQVLVSDFTPSPFKVSTEIGGDTFRPGDTMTIETLARLHSGGAYADAVMRATVTLKPRAFTSNNPAFKNFIFGSSENGYDEQIFQKSSKLNEKGEWNEDFIIPQKTVYFGKIVVESAVQDDRGKSVAAEASADYFGTDRYIGILSPQWFYESKKPLILQSVVVDEKGNPAEGTTSEILIEYEEISTAKVKGAGNAYLSDITREWKQVATCSATSTLEASDCTFTPDKAGTYRVTASVADTKGRPHQTKIILWVSGNDYVQWNDEENLTLPVLPEKNEYKVGDIAKFLVKNPYPGALALITVERYGIIEHRLQKLEGSAPIIEIPVKPDYLPGFYVSVIITSPRAEAPPPALGQIDMGKPAFRIGYAEISVNDPYKEIIVEAKAEQDVYRPRDIVKVSVSTKMRSGEDNKKPIELTVVVLDESVFDLLRQGRDAYDPYKAFYKLEAIDLRNYSLLYKLIGRQKFEKKGANPGGDGGGDLDMRNLFKFVSYWNPALRTDENGNAVFEFEAPDNLTGWKILTLATTAEDRMGLGEGNFKVNRPTEIRPVMPNQVHEGDQFKAGFSIMNRSDKPRTIEVSIEAAGDIQSETQTIRKTESFTLEPYKRMTVYTELQAALLPITRDIEQGEITLKVKGGDEADSDGLEYSLPVNKKRVIEVAANYATTTEGKAEEQISVPQDIYTDTGDISVSLSPSVISGLTGAFKYMRDYPYPCWEQILSRGVMAAHYIKLRPWIQDDFNWQNSEKIPQSVLSLAANYQAPNGGMTYFIATDEHSDPYLSAYTALALSWLKKDGYIIPVDVEKKLHTYLLDFLRRDTAPDFYQDGMTSSVRAVALAALAMEKKINLDDILRYRPHVKDMNLFGKAHFLLAASGFEQAKNASEETLNMIFAKGNETGGKFIFSETLDDGYLRILSTPLRDNCAVLSSLLSYQSTPQGKNIIGDKPFKLVRTITQSRENRDHWENTQENMFCMNAMVDYARIYENTKPNMKVTALLNQIELGTAGFFDFKDKPVTLTQAINSADTGKSKTLTLDINGEGRLYYNTRLRYAPNDSLLRKTNAGMDITREYAVFRDGKWLLINKDSVMTRGENVRVDLFLNLPTARNFVVVNDPLPGGLETVNRDLATASSIDAAQAPYDENKSSMWFKFNDWREYNYSFSSFYHKELRHDSVRFYSDWLEPGNYHLSYMTQVIADGSFAAPPARAEEMYDDDIYGRSDAAIIQIKTDTLQ